MQECWFCFQSRPAALKENFDGTVYDLYGSHMVPELPDRKMRNTNLDQWAKVTVLDMECMGISEQLENDGYYSYFMIHLSKKINYDKEKKQTRISRKIFPYTASY